MAFSVSLLKLAVSETAGSLLRFPYWWYTEGLSRMVRVLRDGLVFRYRSYAIGLWAKNILVPMYGQYDITGRLVSFFMRFVILVWRCAAFAVEALFNVVLVVLWIAMPVLSLVMLLEPLTRPFIG
ncbi:hypothetical protein IT407_03555 [Candidatus Uhrbacteria bacterium]|nr:hypothetical protein [Candidatus Uhrbacteria bacterium]